MALFVHMERLNSTAFTLNQNRFFTLDPSEFFFNGFESGSNLHEDAISEMRKVNRIIFEIN
jgi:hypothetical protein